MPSYAPAAPRGPWRLGPRGQRWFDRTLVVLLLLPAPSWLIGDYARWTFALFPVLEIAPLWWRRSHPVLVFAAVAAATGLQSVVVSEPLYGQIAFAIAVYSVARYASLRAGLVAVGVGLVGAVVAAYRWVGHYLGAAGVNANTMAQYAVTIAAIVLTAWALGLTLQSRARYVAGLVERAEQAVRAADQQAALAAADERARIARDMHDVVAHGLSVIVVQADGARYAAASNPQAVARPWRTSRRPAGRPWPTCDGCSVCCAPSPRPTPARNRGSPTSPTWCPRPAPRAPGSRRTCRRRPPRCPTGSP